MKKENFNFDTEVFLKISHPDIENYLLFAESSATAKKLKRYKSMKAYNYFLCGWVRKIVTKSLKDESCLILGKVRKCFSFKSSQRLHWCYKNISISS